MGLIDVVIIAVIAIGVLDGFSRGFINQLASIVGLIVGFFIAKALYLVLADKLSVYLLSGTSLIVIRALAFMAIWILIPALFALLGSLLTHTIKLLALGGVNRFLGLVFGGLKWILMISIIINVMDFIDFNIHFIRHTKKEESILYYPIKNIISCFFIHTPEDVSNN